MSEAALRRLQQLFPQRYALLPDEVAHVLKGSNTRGVVQKVREGMKSGRYPGARKIDGHMQLPLEDLAEILDPMPDPKPVVPVARPRSSTRRSSIGPRVAFIRQGGFWEEVFRAIGEADQANLLHLEWVAELKQLRKDEAESISNRQRMELFRSTQ
jgi:hypothetical protein